MFDGELLTLIYCLFSYFFLLVDILSFFFLAGK